MVWIVLEFIKKFFFCFRGLFIGARISCEPVKHFQFVVPTIERLGILKKLNTHIATLLYGLLILETKQKG